MTENEKQEAFDKWYDENYDEWAEGEEGIALREELEQAFKSGIAELENENEQITISYETLKLHDEEEIGMLKSENADLKCECRRCVYSDTFCIVSDYGKDKNGICDHFKDVFDELQNWKDEWQEQVQKATDEGYARTLQTIQLNKAKKIIQRLVTKLYKYTRFTDDVLAEAELFLKEE